MNRAGKITIVLAILLAAIVAFYWPTPQTGALVPMRFKYIAFALSMLFPIALAFLVVGLDMDGFAAGTMAIAAGLQTTVYVGWVESPQQEAFRFFLGATLFMAILMVVTVWFHRLQIER